MITWIKKKLKEQRNEKARQAGLKDMQKYTEALKGTGDIVLGELKKTTINGEEYYAISNDIVLKHTPPRRK